MSDSFSYIEADARTISQILDKQRYEVDVFQREYRWGKKNIEQLLEDLTGKFLESYSEDDDLKQVKNYSRYYMGSIILNVKDSTQSIIDGQQRLTSITLLLIYLNNLQKNLEKPVSSLSQLIASDSYGDFNLNLQIEDRLECMLSLFKEEQFEFDDKNESIQNIQDRYTDISEMFPHDLTQKALSHFIYWLIDNVIFVVIKTRSDDDAYKIFETMNDRGLSLTPTEMLKGHLLSKFNEDVEKKELNELWKKQISKIKDLDKNSDMEFIQAWLRSKYADTIRQPKKDAHDEDFEIIGSKPHSWLKDNEKQVGLNTVDDYRNFIQKNFVFFSNQYEKIFSAAHKFDKDFEHIFYVAFCRLAPSLYFPLMLAPIDITDDEKTIDQKINLVSKFLESFIVRRKVNSSSIAHSNLRIKMYNLIKEIRNKSIPELVEIFRNTIDEMDEQIDEIYEYGLGKVNKSFVKFLLARFTSYIEEKSMTPNSSFEKYIRTERNQRFEIEHILANKFSEHSDEYDDENNFSEYRNSLGGLILLPRKINQSYGALPYSEKLEYYYAENLLARSLHANCYERNPGFLTFVKESHLPFTNYSKFGKNEIDERQKLYQKISEEIWGSDIF
jgi:uncharacterized protein with ParB-like and HNH nuclease domain